jgi:hypothetical protein
LVDAVSFFYYEILHYDALSLHSGVREEAPFYQSLMVYHLGPDQDAVRSGAEIIFLTKIYGQVEVD